MTEQQVFILAEQTLGDAVEWTSDGQRELEGPDAVTRGEADIRRPRARDIAKSAGADTPPRTTPGQSLQDVLSRHGGEWRGPGLYGPLVPVS
ncbi:MAG TPA: hypothetical protein VK576_02070 [Thermoleophilia bacterium]|nr:hypothetical protein [Thermoleophilia bacterium]